MADKDNSGGKPNQGSAEPDFELVEEDGTAVPTTGGEGGGGEDDSQRQARGQQTDDDDDGQGGEGGGTDERLGQRPGDEGGESQAELSARQRRRQRERQARNAERAELARLRAENDQLRQDQSRVEKRLSNVETNTVDSQIAQLEAEIAKAGRVMAAASGPDGNKQDFADALEIRDALRDRLRDLKSVKTKQEAETRGAADGGRADGQGGDSRLDGQPGAGFRPTKEQAQNARVFLSRHPWYKLQGGDEDSQTVTAIDNEMMAEGGNPSTADYWNELERRVYEELPHRKPQANNGGGQGKANGAANGGGNGGGGEWQGGARRAGGPRLPGGGNSGGTPGGPQKFHLSALRKQALIDIGVYDPTPGATQDMAKLRPYIQRFQRWDKEHPST